MQAIDNVMEYDLKLRYEEIITLQLINDFWLILESEEGQFHPIS